MEAKETAGLPMTERVARDCSSGLLETTSNRLWSTAKTNTHQLLQKKRRGERKRGRGRPTEKKEGLVTKQKCLLADQRKIKIEIQGDFGFLTENERKDNGNGENSVAVSSHKKNPFSNTIRYGIINIF